jgi:hypothetical protein
MSNQIENSIIYKLPRELQIECLQYLIPNERLLLVGNNERLLIIGSNDNDKTIFINRLTQSKKYFTVVELHTNKFNIIPTKIIILMDATSYSYHNYIPFYKYLKIPFIILNQIKDSSPFARIQSISAVMEEKIYKKIFNDNIEIILHHGFESRLFSFNYVESILFDKNDYKKYQILKQKYSKY